MIAVFLKNKLVSCDTITPVMLAVKQQAPDKKIYFYIGDWRGYEAIKANVFLYDAIQKIGPLRCFARRPGKSWIAHRLWAISWLLGLAVRTVLRRVQFIHFQALNERPFNFLARLNPSNVFFFENTCWHYHMNERRADSHARERLIPAPVLGRQNRVGFNDEWAGFKGPGGPKYQMPPSRQLKAWREYVEANSQGWFEEEFKNAGIPKNDKIIVFVLGAFVNFDFMREEKSVATLVEETLGVLSELAHEHAIFIKPHAITDRAILDEILSKYQNVPFIITGLHPTLLATRARVFISNYYSTTQADAVSMGVPTIEYSDYSESFLERSNGGSMNPRYITNFVNSDVDEFRRTLKEVLKSQAQAQPTEPLIDDSGVIDRLVTGKWAEQL